MPYDRTTKPTVAIVGAGISGLATAYELRHSHDVTLIETSGRLGGHARTVMAGKRGDQPVDTGFIVFNYHNYPNLTRMFGELDVPVKPSDMSFSASVGGGRIEYGLKDVRAMLAQKRNLLRPGYARMFRDILRFNARARDVAHCPDMTVGEMLDALRLGEWFRRYYLLPVSGAIWSSTPEQMAEFPARSLVQFFDNHALLSHRNHKWWTVDGGSIEYVNRVEAALRQAGGQIRLGAPVAGIRRDALGAELRCAGGEWERFDDIVLACHSDDALNLLSDASPEERAVLGRVGYQSNRAVLHADPALMPRRRAAWASWSFISPDQTPRPAISLTYWMNSLQGIAQDDPLFVSLNPTLPIREDLIYDEAEFRHPVFDRAAVAAQAALPGIQGRRATWFCGAWARWGFHEDGYHSAMAVVDRMRVGMPVLEAAE